MSTEIENQVVQVTFDNKEFERNIRASMDSLDEFKDELEFKDEAKGFKELEKASESINFEKLNNAVDKIGDHFTILGKVAYKVSDDIATYLESKITGVVNSVKSVTTDIIDPKAGYGKYDDYTHGVKAIMAALSDEEKEKILAENDDLLTGVENKLGELMAYTDETSYNFTEMVNTIGKFLGNGVSFNDSLAAMQGIANWAALAGQNSQTATQAMYQMSQALGAGFVKYQDWKEMATTKNMGTVQAKDAFINAARELGYIQDEDIAQAKKAIVEAGGLEKNWRNWFFESEQLTKAQWFKTEVLIKGLNDFSSVSNNVISLLGEVSDSSTLTMTKFLRQADKVKKGTITVNEAVANLGDSCNLTEEDLKMVAESMKFATAAENDMAYNAIKNAQQAVTFREALDATKDAAGTAWLTIFESLIGNLDEAASLWTDFSNDLYDLFVEPLYGISDALVPWGKQLVTFIDKEGEEVEGTMRSYMWDSVAQLGQAFGSIFSTFFDYFRFFKSSIPSLGDVATSVMDGLVNAINTLKDVFDDIANSRTLIGLAAILKELTNLVKNLYQIISKPLKAALKSLFSVEEDAYGSTVTLDKAFASFLASITAILKAVNNLLEAFIGSEGFEFAIKVASKVVEFFIGRLERLATYIKAIAFILTGRIDEAMFILRDSMSKTFESFSEFFKFNPSKGLSLISGAFKKLTGMVEAIFKSISKVFNKLKETFGSAGNETANFFEDVIKKIGKFIEKAIDKFADFFEWFKPYAKKAQNFVTTIFVAIKDALKESGERLGIIFENLCDDIFERLPARWNKMMNAFKTGDGPKKVEAVLDFIGDCIKAGVNRIIDAIEALTGYDLSGFSEYINWFMEKIAQTADKLKPGFEQAWEGIKKAFKAIADAFVEITDAVLYVIQKATGIENFSWEDVIDYVINVMAKLVELAAWLIGKTGDALIAMGPTLEYIGVALADGLHELWLALTYAIGMDKTDEALNALNNVKRILLATLGIFILIETISFFKLIKNFIGTLNDAVQQTALKGTSSLASSLLSLVKAISTLMFAMSFLANQKPEGIIGAGVVLIAVIFMIKKFLSALLKTLSEIYVELTNHYRNFDQKSFEAVLKGYVKIFKSFGSLMTRIVLSIAILAIVERALGDKGEDIVADATFSIALILTVLVFGLKAIIKAGSKIQAKDAETLTKISKLVGKLQRQITILMSKIVAVAVVFDFLMSVSKNATESIFLAVTTTVAAMGILILSVIAITKVGEKLSQDQVTRMEALQKILTKIALSISILSLTIVAMAAILQKIMGNDPLKNTGWLWYLGIAGVVLVAGAALVIGISTVLGHLGKGKGGEATTALEKFLDILTKQVKLIVKVSFTMDALISFVAITIGVIGLFVLLIKKTKIEELVEAIVGTAIIFGMFAILFKILGNLNIEARAGQILALAVLVIAMSIAITIFSKALKMLTEVSGKEGNDIGTAFLAIIGIAVALMAMSVALSFVQVKDLLGVSLGMLAFSAAVIVMVGALLLLSNFGGEKLWPALGVFVALAAVLIAFSFAVSFLTPCIAAIGAFGAAVLIFVAAMALLAVISYFVQPIIDGIKEITKNLGPLVDAIITLIITALNDIANAIRANSVEIVEAIWNLFEALLELALVAVWSVLGHLFGELNQRIFEGGKDAIVSLWNGIVSAWNWIVDKISGFFKRLFGKVKKDDLGEESPSKIFAEMGEFLIKGLWEGISRMGNWIKDKIGGFCKGVVNGFCKFFGINSPSTVMAGIGDFLVQGLDVGIGDAKDKLFSTIKEVGSGIISNFMPEGGLAGALGLGDLKNALSGDLGLDGLTDSLNMDNIMGDFNMDSMMNGMNIGSITGDLNMPAFDASSLGLSSTYGMNIVPSMGGVDGLDIPTNYQPTVDDAQINQITSSYEDRSEDIINAINNLRETVAGQSEAISKFQMVLDTGVIVGELVNPLDKALGNKTRLASSRGV